MAENQPYFEFNSKRDADADFEAILNSHSSGQKISSEELDAIEQQIKGLNENLDNLDGEERENAEREIKHLRIKRNQVAIKDSLNSEHLQALENNPETYTALYSIKNNVEEADEAKAHLEIGENDQLKLKIQMLQPMAMDIDIVDGKVQFSPEGMTPEKMHDMIAFLQTHGIVVNDDSLKLENADQETQEVFEEAMEQFDDENQGEPQVFSFTGYGDGDYEEVTDSSYDPADEIRGHWANDATAENFPAEEPKTEENEEQEEGSTGLFGGKVPQKADHGANAQKEEFDKSVTTWMNKNKRKGFSWFEGSTYNGWDTFTCYSGENPKQNRTPITVDHKTGAMKCNYEFKIYSRMKNGRLEICFSLPPGKNLTDDQAYLITSALKDAGVKYVEYQKGTKAMSDSNEAIMRTACGKRLLVPTEHKVNTERYDKMIAAASQKVGANSPELYRYKYDLAMQMDKLLRKKGVDYRDPSKKNNPDCRTIRWAVGAYQLHPFRDLWEDFGLRGDYEKRLSEGTPSDPKCTDPNDGAKKVIGAKMAVGSLYEMFSDNASQDVAHLLSKDCKSLNDNEKGVLQAYVDNNGLSKDTQVRDMPPAALRAIYAEMCKTQEAKVKDDIEKEYFEILRRNKENGSKDDPEKGAVKEIFGRADTYIQDMNEQLKDCNLSQIFLARKAMPKHDFGKPSENGGKSPREKAIEEGLVRVQTPRTNTGNGGNRNNNGRNNGGR